MRVSTGLGVAPFSRIWSGCENRENGRSISVTVPSRVRVIQVPFGASAARRAAERG